MNYNALPILKTNRLLLRPVTIDDATDIFAYASDPEVSKLLHWYPSTSLEETKEIIKQWLTNYQENKPAPWVIVDKVSNNVIGTIDIKEHNDNNTECAYLGYCLSQHYWGKGLMPEAVTAVIKYIFTQTKIKKIVAFCRVDNPQSCRVLEKCSFKKDGEKQKEIKGVAVTLDRFVLYKNKGSS